MTRTTTALLLGVLWRLGVHRRKGELEVGHVTIGLHEGGAEEGETAHVRVALDLDTLLTTLLLDGLDLLGASLGVGLWIGLLLLLLAATLFLLLLLLLLLRLLLLAAAADNPEASLLGEVLGLRRRIPNSSKQPREPQR